MDINFNKFEIIKTQVLLEQLTSSPLTHFLFMVYYGWIVEGMFRPSSSFIPAYAICHLFVMYEQHTIQKMQGDHGPKSATILKRTTLQFKLQLGWYAQFII